MPDETLRLKDIDPSEFAAQVSQAVIDHTTKKYGIVFCRKMWGGRKGKEALTEVFRLAKDIAIAARDNTWPRKTRADDAVAAVSSLVYGQLLDDPKYAGIDVRASLRGRAAYREVQRPREVRLLLRRAARGDRTRA